jgi:hypothetical protein
MSEIAIGMTAPDGVALTVLTHLKNGKIDDAIARFVDKLTCKDHGMGLEFKDKERLSAFFRLGDFSRLWWTDRSSHISSADL